MKQLVKKEVPSIGNDIQRNTQGQVVSMIDGKERVVFMGHEEVEVPVPDHRPEAEGNGSPVRTERRTIAFEVRIPMPVTRAKAITAAEMEAYELVTALDVASFNAGLARKQREGVDIQEVTDHDEFIGWVKNELTKIGI